MYSLTEIKAMQRSAVELELLCPDYFLQMPPDQLQKIANGYGPERWPESCRKAIGWFFRHYTVPAAVHDVRYEFSDGMEPTRRAADAEFRANLQLVWQQRYGWLRWVNPVAIYDLIKLQTASQLTSEFGRRAWLEAYRKNKNRRNEGTVDDE